MILLSFTFLGCFSSRNDRKLEMQRKGWRDFYSPGQVITGSLSHLWACVLDVCSSLGSPQNLCLLSRGSNKKLRKKKKGDRIGDIRGSSDSLKIVFVTSVLYTHGTPFRDPELGNARTGVHWGLLVSLYTYGSVPRVSRKHIKGEQILLPSSKCGSMRVGKEAYFQVPVVRLINFRSFVNFWFWFIQKVKEHLTK